MSWPLYSLDQLGSVSRGKSRHRPRDAEHLYGGPYPFIQTGDVKHAPMYVKNFSQTYSEAGLAQSKLWPQGTLCITIAANIAETAILDIDACFPDSIIGFIPDEDKTSSKFVKYQFDALLKVRMRQVSHGAAQDNLSQQKLLSFEFPVPDLSTQEKLVKRLSNYDDLIENNRRRIALLEESALLLYREWFVHHRFQDQTAATKGMEFPLDCNKCKLGDVLTLQRGFDLPAAKRVKGSVPVFGSTGIVGFHNEAKVKYPTVLTGRSGSLGKVIMTESESWPLNTTLWMKELKISSIYFAFFLLQNLPLKSFNGGAAVPTLDRNVLHELDVVVPSPSTLSKFDKEVEVIFCQIRNFEKQNDALTKARDLLLPRLMDGRIAV